MREFAKFGTGFWTSPAIQALSIEAKLLAAYLISGPHSNQAGIYRIPDGYVSEDIGMGSETLSKGFAELRVRGFATRCERTKWVIVHKAMQHTPPDNVNQAKHIANLIEQVPAGASIWPAISEAVSLYVTASYGAARERIQALIASRLTPAEANPSETLPEPFRTIEKEKEIEKEREKEKERTTSAPSCSALDAESDSAPLADVLPITLNDGSEWRPSVPEFDELQTLYPALDVPQCFRSMRAWCMSHPKERKTRRGVMAFVTGWLQREQNRGGVARLERRGSGPPSRPDPRAAAARSIGLGMDNDEGMMIDGTAQRVG